ncbi:MAG: HD domain-containing protein [Phycisphaeraceae bacterium]
MPSRILISDLQPNQLIEGTYCLINCQLGQTKGGKPYIKCLIGDKSARVPGRMWNVTDDLFGALPTDGFVFLRGQTQPYQGEMQIIIQSLRAVQPTHAELMELLPRTKRDVEQMYAEVGAILRDMKDPHLRRLADAYLDDAAMMEKFQQAPAAQNLHHAYLGGLLEHTHNLLTLAERVLPLYPELNADVVLLGLFLHDMGKCAELYWDTGFGYTEDGQLIGHVGRGVLWLQRKLDQCQAAGQKVPDALAMVMHHIILSHHGVPEFGALKVPSTPEAIAVSMLDNLDAKIHMGIAARGDLAKEGLGGNFTEKIWALDTRVYRPDPTTVPDAPASPVREPEPDAAEQPMLKGGL